MVPGGEARRVIIREWMSLLSVGVQRWLATPPVPLPEALVPSHQGGQDDHQHDARSAHRDLGNNAGRPFEQDDVRREGQEYSGAEDLKRVLPAEDGLAENRRLPSGPFTRDEAQDNERERQEMHES